MCSLYVISSGMVAFFHVITAGFSENIRSICRHHKITTNEGLSSHKLHVDKISINQFNHVIDFNFKSNVKMMNTNLKIKKIFFF